MKIKTITTQIKYIPLKTPFITALRRVENVEFVRVEIICDNGLIGIGEAPATKVITNEGLEDILESVQKIKKYFINQSIDDTLSILHTQCNIGSSAKASLDMAIFSLLSQQKRQTLFEYLGAKVPRVLQTDITISLKSAEAMLQDSIDAYDNGLDILKVKLGSDISHAIEVTKSIAKALPKAKLIIDANQAWSVDSSLTFIEAMQEVEIELIEQPVVAKDIKGLKLITQKSHIQILADEAVFTLEDVKEVIESKSADMINIKLMKCGGLSKAIEILEYAKKMKIKCMLGSMLEGPYSINAALHLAMAYPDEVVYIDLDSPLLYKEEIDALEFEFSQNWVSFKFTF